MSARIVLCGRLEVEIAGRRVEQRLPGLQGPLVIAVLTLNRDRPVRRDEMIEALWPARPPTDPDDVLNALLSKVRHAIGKDVLTGRREAAAGGWVGRSSRATSMLADTVDRQPGRGLRRVMRGACDWMY